MDRHRPLDIPLQRRERMRAGGVDVGFFRATLFVRPSAGTRTSQMLLSGVRASTSADVVELRDVTLPWACTTSPSPTSVSTPSTSRRSRWPSDEPGAGRRLPPAAGGHHRGAATAAQRQFGITQILDRLAATARERASSEDLSPDERHRYEEVARLATELNAAVTAVEQSPPPGEAPAEGDPPQGRDR